MKQDDKYYIHHKPMTRDEAAEYIAWYRASVRKDYDRHMVMLRHVPGQSYVLDYGCGWGVFAEMMHSERECRVDGIDPDPHSVRVAKELIPERPGLSFSTRRIQDIDDQVYDVVVSSEVIEHTHNPGMYLGQCNRVLKPDGYLVISIPNIMTLRHILGTLLVNQRKRFRFISREMKDGYDKTQHHVQAWDPATFCRLVGVMGFEYIGHEFMEGWALPKNRYWRNPWGKLKNLSYKIVFKLRKDRFVDVQPFD